MCATRSLFDQSKPTAQAGRREHPPTFDGLPCEPVDRTRDPRDPRRTWARLLPRSTFTNPAARLLAEWADAILSEDGWEAWTAAHPKEGAPL